MKILYLLIGVFGQFLSLSQMIKYNNQTQFKTPFFTINMKKYRLPFENNADTLRNYQKVLFYDNFLALSYFITYLSLYYLLNFKIRFIQILYLIVIPSQSILDWIENYILSSQIDSFLKDKTIKNQYLFLVVSSVKWLFSVLTFGLYLFGLIKLVLFLL